MAAPKNELVRYEYQNPHASGPLVIPMLVVSNTSDADLERNIRHNTSLNLNWLFSTPAHDGVAVMVGGGASVKDDVEEIKALRKGGATVFAMNAASKWAHKNGITVDFQVIADAKEETAILVDPHADGYLLASQVHPATMAAVRSVNDPILWHLEIGDVERFFPKEKIKRGGYSLVGGGASVGNSALCVAYVMGYRHEHLFGYDSSHSDDDQSHAYRQAMNDRIPCVNVEWGGRTFKASVAMKAQAEKFQLTAQGLQQSGCKIEVHGDGLLPQMWRTPVADLTEREKYQTMWKFDTYREHSPGEMVVDKFLDVVQPDGMIIDFGCGTGRAGLALDEKGHDVLLVDFASNCRDEEAMRLHFAECDLTLPLAPRAKYGLCTDVMEHIQPHLVECVIANIMAAVDECFFQISTLPDSMGAFIGTDLHLTVEPAAWWRWEFEKKGYFVVWQSVEPEAVLLHVRNGAE